MNTIESAEGCFFITHVIFLLKKICTANISSFLERLLNLDSFFYVKCFLVNLQHTGSLLTAAVKFDEFKKWTPVIFIVVDICYVILIYASFTYY